MKTNRDIMLDDIKKAWWSGPGVLTVLSEQELHKIWAVVMLALPRLNTEEGESDEAGV